MRKNNIKNIDVDYLTEIGFTEEQINIVFDLINRGIKEKLYTKYFIPYHSLEHIIRVICYSIWILNKKASNGEKLKNKELLLYSALYHDCGRSLIVFNKTHGIISARIAKEKLKKDYDDKELNIIEILIETHAKTTDNVDFKNYDFSENERKNIQELSNILKDADALDRNRIKLFKFAQCNPKYLRTDEAKEIYYMSNLFLENIMKKNTL